jgi:hypothetical protein
LYRCQWPVCVGNSCADLRGVIGSHSSTHAVLGQVPTIVRN